MKIGYSLSLSEILSAEEVEYGDCARFQIVCPACRQAVFKKLREQRTHYLAHYKADSDEARECELRVAAMSRDLLARWSAEGRAQTLAKFLKVLRQEVLAGQQRLGFISENDLQANASALMRRSDFAQFVPDLDEAIRFMLDSKTGYDGLASAISDVPSFQTMSGFWIRRQASYVHDVLLHLNTAQAKPNRTFLAACACVLTIKVPHAFNIRKSEFPECDIRPALTALVNGKPERRVARLLEDASRRQLDKAHVRGYKAGIEHTMLTTQASPNPIPAPKTKSDLLTTGLPKRESLPIFSFGEEFSFIDSIDDAKTQIEKIEKGKLKAEEKRLLAELNRNKILQDLIHLQATSLLMGPLIGLLAAVPFPDIAANQANISARVA